MDDRNRDDALGQSLFGISIIFGILLLLLIFMIDWPTSWEEWGGNGAKAPADVLAAILTPIGAIVAIVGLAWNVRNTNRTLQNSVKSEMIQRFQKACEMSGSQSASTAIGGISLLRALSNEDPNTYLVPVIEVLGARATELSEAGVKSVYKTFDFSITGHTNAIVYAALETISNIGKHHHDWPKEVITDGRMPLVQLLISGISFVDQYFSKIRCSYWAMDDCTFERCNFSGSTLIIVLGSNVRFIDCNLTEAVVQVMEPDRSFLWQGAEQWRLRFSRCETVGATVNNQTMENWQNLGTALMREAGIASDQPS